MKDFHIFDKVQKHEDTSIFKGAKMKERKRKTSFFSGGNRFHRNGDVPQTRIPHVGFLSTDPGLQRWNGFVQSLSLSLYTAISVYCHLSLCTVISLSTIPPCTVKYFHLQQAYEHITRSQDSLEKGPGTTLCIV